MVGAGVLSGLGTCRALRNWSTGLFAQDEWRATSRLTINYAFAEVNPPFTEVRDRLNTFVPASNRPFIGTLAGRSISGDKGVAEKQPFSGRGSCRASVRVESDGRGDRHPGAPAGFSTTRCRTGKARRSAPVSSLPDQLVQFSGPERHL
jgi:hypothetical protein